MTSIFPATCSSTTLQQWDDFSQFNKDRGEAEMKAATELREAIALTIAEVTGHPQLMDGPSVCSALIFCSLLCMWPPAPRLSNILRQP